MSLLDLCSLYMMTSWCFLSSTRTVLESPMLCREFASFCFCLFLQIWSALGWNKSNLKGKPSLFRFARWLPIISWAVCSFRRRVNRWEEVEPDISQLWEIVSERKEFRPYPPGLTLLKNLRSRRITCEEPREIPHNDALGEAYTGQLHPERWPH